jgi:hypothetical protein
MDSRDHSETCSTCGRQRGELNDYKCACDVSEGRSFHRARLGAWTSSELRDQLTAIMDHLDDEKGNGYVSPLDVVLELLEGELEAFVLFGRVGHLDPPREDGKVPIAILQCKSEDPMIDGKIRECAKKWAIEQEQRS